MLTTDDKIRDEQQKYQHYHLEKLINMNMLQVKKYCLLSKDKQYHKLNLHVLHQETFLTNKQTKNKDQSNKQTKAMEDHGKHLVQSNEIIKKHFNINGDSIPL